MASMHWTFIGAGNMASSLVGGLIGSGVNAKNITVIDVNAAACEKLERSFGVNSAADLAGMEEGAAVVIAVKPNIVETVCKAFLFGCVSCSGSALRCDEYMACSQYGNCSLHAEYPSTVGSGCYRSLCERKLQ